MARVVQRPISIHALREEGDPWTAGTMATTTHFYPRPPRGGRRKRKDWATRMELISIHALREEGDSKRLKAYTQAIQFLSTPSARRATCVMGYITIFTERISIHALREEGDRNPIQTRKRLHRFLSTPSARRATVAEMVPQVPGQIFLSTPSARRATPPYCSGGSKESQFLSTPSARRATEPSTPQSASSDGFLSTPSARRATDGRADQSPLQSISIHALREEGDASAAFSPSPSSSYFYPRPPRGGRPALMSP